MDWVEGFLKKHAQPQALDDRRKVLPPYPGFFVPTMANRGHAVARKQDKKPGDGSFGGSRSSTAPARQPASTTFQTGSRLCPGTGQLQYDGAIL